MKASKERKIDTEKYYTSKKAASLVVRHFIEQEPLLWEHTQGVIEPSAGGGVFLNVLQDILEHRKVVAFDIDPTAEHIISCDFLKLSALPSSFQHISPEHIVCIGNPPFGIRGALARKFLNKCAMYSNNLLMILPISFKTESVLSNVDQYFHIKWSLDLPPNIWTTIQGEATIRKVKTAAFFLIKKDIPREKPQRMTFDLVNRTTNGKWTLISTKTSNKKNNQTKRDNIRNTDVAIFLWGKDVDMVRNIKDFKTECYHVVRLTTIIPDKKLLLAIKEEHIKVRAEKSKRSTLGTMVATSLSDLILIMNNTLDGIT